MHTSCSVELSEQVEQYSQFSYAYMLICSFFPNGTEIFIKACEGCKWKQVID